MHGFDLSHYNSDEQWRACVNSADFLFHKASESTNYIDPKLMARVKSTDKPMGIYHVIRPSVNPWGKEFDHFCSVIDKVSAIRPVGIALDLEVNAKYVPYNSGNDIKVWIVNLISALNRRYNRPVICYMGDLYPDHWYEDFKKAGAIFWIARWTPSEASLEHDATFWQYTSKYGGGNLDADKTLKDDSEVLSALCYGDVKQVKEHVTNEQVLDAITILALAVIDGRFGIQPQRGELINGTVQSRVNEILKEVKDV